MTPETYKDRNSAAMPIARDRRQVPPPPKGSYIHPHVCPPRPTPEHETKTPSRLALNSRTDQRNHAAHIDRTGRKRKTSALKVPLLPLPLSYPCVEAGSTRPCPIRWPNQKRRQHGRVAQAETSPAIHVKTSAIRCTWCLRDNLSNIAPVQSAKMNRMCGRAVF